MTAIAKARAGFRAQFGVDPDGVAFAPGRVNLIGEHVDYNDGLVLPMPISVGTAVAWQSLQGPSIEAVALDFDGEHDRFKAASPQQVAAAGWQTYLRGMVASMLVRGMPVGCARLAIAGSLPRGSGLSSSASLCVAVGRALSAAAGIQDPDPRELALAAQQAEHEWAGVHCGIMDQMVVSLGKPGAALLLDCRSLESEAVKLPRDWAVLIVQSGVRRELVDGHYNARRAACAAAARALGIASLRDANVEEVQAAQLDDETRARARHVVSEIARVEQAVAAIAAEDLPGLGRCLNASHASLRDDFAVTVPAIDALVAALQAAIGPGGGARMTGAGFGGAAVAICDRSQIDRVRAELLGTYRCPDGTAPEFMIETPEPYCAGEAT